MFDCSKEQTEHLTNICMHVYEKHYPPLHSRKSLLSRPPRLKPYNLPMFGCGAPQAWGVPCQYQLEVKGQRFAPVSTFTCAISLPNRPVDR